MRVNDAVLGALFILGAVWMIWMTGFFPSFPGQDYGPDLFPRLIAGGIILCGIGLIGRGVAARRAGHAWLERAPWMGEPHRLASFLFVAGSILLYILLADWLGFIPLAFAILLGLFLWFGAKPIRAIPVAIAMTWAINWFFGSMMRVPLPRGLLDSLL